MLFYVTKNQFLMLKLFPSTQKQNIWQPIKETRNFDFKRTEA